MSINMNIKMLAVCRVTAGLVLFAKIASLVFGEVRLPPLFGDHMVMQSGKSAAVWGWADAGEKVRVCFADGGGNSRSEASAVAGGDGKWLVKLPPLKAGEAGTLTISTDGGERREIKDVLAGDVWLGSGQSNMEYKVGASNVPKEMVMEAEKDARNAETSIRFFSVTKVSGSPKPLPNVGGEWLVVTPENVRQFSAVAWYFAQGVHAKTGIPVGMITTAWGGTPVEAWMSEDMLNATAASKKIWKRHEELLASYTPEKVKKMQDALARWQKENPTPELQRKNARTKPKYPYWETSSRVPVRLYNGMLHGVIPYTLQGFIWYQGEANASRPSSYGELICAMVNGWRKEWGEELPFYYVELASYQARQKEPAQDRCWASIREAQAAVLKLPKTGVATAIDLGQADNVHPPFKRPVGERLAGLALKQVHGMEELVESPQFASCAFLGSEARVKLDYAAGLHIANGTEVRGFAICGGDKQWKWAKGRIDGESVVLWREDIKQPVAVRYAWANNPVLSLANKSGLPLRSFRTDRDSPNGYDE